MTDFGFCSFDPWYPEVNYSLIVWLVLPLIPLGSLVTEPQPALTLRQGWVDQSALPCALRES